MIAPQPASAHKSYRFICRPPKFATKFHHYIRVVAAFAWGAIRAMLSCSQFCVDNSHAAQSVIRQRRHAARPASDFGGALHDFGGCYADASTVKNNFPNRVCQPIFSC